MKAPIESIRIKERIRKEISKIPELAADLGKNGLLHPVTVMETDGGGLQLLAGLRRVKAAQSLGWMEIDVIIVSPADAEAELQIVISENEQREQFTYSEQMDYARLFEEIESAKAKERMLSGKKNSDPLDGRPEGTYTREIVGAKIGMSGRQYSRAKYVADNAPPEMIEQLDKGGCSVNKAYKELRAKEPPKVVFASESRDIGNDPFYQKLQAESAEALRIQQEFDALTPEGKIEELERQVEKQRIRAVAAESSLARLQSESGITIDHKTSIIEGLEIYNARLIAMLEEADARIKELEARILELEA